MWIKSARRRRGRAPCGRIPAMVALPTSPAAAVPAAARSDAAARPVAAWLFVCCVLVFAMVVVGGVTRLTHSGLSITEWQPIVGTLPPLTDAAWEEAFAKYRATPEFRQVNQRDGAAPSSRASSGGSTSTGCSAA